jgi:hypothetical protein
MSTDNSNGQALDWDSPIQNDGNEFVLFSEGDYDFMVKALERAVKTGTKYGDVKVAKLTLEVTHEGKTTELKADLMLHSKLEWKLCQFFTAIGQRKHGEQLKPQWNKVPGAKGRCHVTQEEVDSKKEPGKKLKVNRVEKFLDPSASISDDQF